MGETAQLSFALKISGEFFSIWAKFPQISKFFNGRNSPKSEKIRPKFLTAILNFADSPGSPEIYLLCTRQLPCSN
jgi:hypothetical protein